MDDLIQSLTKKDEDLRIIEQTSTSITIESDTLIDDIDEALDDSTNNSQARISVPVQVARTVFLVQALYTFLVMFWGIVPYYFFRADVSTKGLEWMLLVSGLLCLLTYVGMKLIVNEFFRSHTMALWFFFMFVSTNLVAALLKNLAPFQAVSILFCQSMSIIIYSFVEKRKLEFVRCLVALVSSGLIAWLIGLIAFIRYNDWIISFVLFLVFVCGSAVYTAYQIKWIDRFGVSRTDQIEAIVCYYTDPLFVSWEWIQNKWRTMRNRSESSN